MSDTQDRIREYLAHGGLFNPDLMAHDAVRDLIMDCRDDLATERARADKAEEELDVVKRKHEWNVGIIRGIADAIKPLCSTEQRDAIDKAMK